MNRDSLWKIEAEGDVVYTYAINEADAYARLTDFAGMRIPLNLVTFTAVLELPEGEEVF